MFNYRRFSEVLQSAEDFIVDIPKFWEYLAELVEPLLGEGGLNFAFLRPFTSSISSPMATTFIAAVFKELVKSKVRLGFTISVDALFVSNLLDHFRIRWQKRVQHNHCQILMKIN